MAPTILPRAIQPSQVATMHCNEVIKGVNLGIKHTECLLSNPAVFAKRGGLACYRRLIKLITVYKATVLRPSGVCTVPVRKRPTKARSGGFRNLTARGRVNPGHCRRRPKRSGKAHDAKQELNPDWCRHTCDQLHHRKSQQDESK